MTENTNEKATPSFNERVMKIISDGKESGLSELEVLKIMDAEISAVWANSENYIDVTVRMPKEIYEEQHALLDSCREAINYFNPHFRESHEEEQPMPQAVVFGHLLVEGTNEILDKYEQKKAAKSLREGAKDFIKIISGGDQEQGGKCLQSLFDLIIDSKLTAIEADEEMGDMASSSPDPVDIQALFDKIGEVGFKEFIELNPEDEEEEEEEEEEEDEKQPFVFEVKKED